MAAVTALTSPSQAAVVSSHPWFFAQLSLANGGHAVLAGGPINWAPGDAWAKIEDVTITQGAVTATSTGATTVRNGRDVNWWLNATASGKFRPGPADAYALEIGHRANGTTYRYYWEMPVQLTRG